MTRTEAHCGGTDTTYQTRSGLHMGRVFNFAEGGESEGGLTKEQDLDWTGSTSLRLRLSLQLLVYRVRDALGLGLGGEALTALLLCFVGGRGHDKREGVTLGDDPLVLGKR